MGTDVSAYDLDLLAALLRDAGIDLSTWGKGKAKTLRHLHEEIASGETVLVERADGTLLREVTVCCAYVHAVAPDGKRYRLREDRQIFADGRERRRDLPESVFGKMQPDEEPRAAMLREIGEELGIAADQLTIAPMRSEVEMVESPSYPGIMSRYSRHIFDVKLHDRQYMPEGYLEVRDGVRTYFVWEEIT